MVKTEYVFVSKIAKIQIVKVVGNYLKSAVVVEILVKGVLYVGREYVFLLTFLLMKVA